MNELKSTRRDFLKASGTAVAGAVFSQTAASYARIIGANDRVSVGIVGFSDRAKSSLIPGLLLHAKELNFEFTALSDIWSRRRDEGAAFLEKKGVKVQLARNNEEMYEKHKPDAVMISTADFQHALHGVEAVKAGCHAYIEKPLADTMEDARAILKAVQASGKIVQIGTQRRSGTNYMAAKNYIESGEFGKIVTAEMSWNVNQPGRWRRPELVESIRAEDTDWKRFLMNRPFEEWDPRKYIEYRLFWPYSSGIPDQWMVHQIDTVHWFTGLKRPRSVVANGGIYLWNDGRKNADTMTAVFEYGPDNDPTQGFQVVYSSRMTNSAGGVKEFYFSKNGMIDLDNNVISPDGSSPDFPPKKDKPTTGALVARKLDSGERKVVTSANTGVDVMTSAHIRNWMECIRSGKTPNADVVAGYNHSVALCMTIAALHKGVRATFDDEKQEVVAG